MLKQTWLPSLLMSKSRKNYANSSNNCPRQALLLGWKTLESGGKAQLDPLDRKDGAGKNKLINRTENYFNGTPSRFPGTELDLKEGTVCPSFSQLFKIPPQRTWKQLREFLR
ncbi:hypothetical protein SLA2020_108750 [Shorea laevis]